MRFWKHIWSDTENFKGWLSPGGHSSGGRALTVKSEASGSIPGGCWFLTVLQNIPKSYGHVVSIGAVVLIGILHSHFQNTTYHMGWNFGGFKILCFSLNCCNNSKSWVKFCIAIQHGVHNMGFACCAITVKWLILCSAIKRSQLTHECSSYQNRRCGETLLSFRSLSLKCLCNCLGCAIDTSNQKLFILCYQNAANGKRIPIYTCTTLYSCIRSFTASTTIAFTSVHYRSCAIVFGFSFCLHKDVQQQLLHTDGMCRT